MCRGETLAALAASNRFPLCTCVDGLTREMSLSVCCHTQSQLCPRTFCVLNFYLLKRKQKFKPKQMFTAHEGIPLANVPFWDVFASASHMNSLIMWENARNKSGYQRNTS